MPPLQPFLVPSLTPSTLPSAPTALVLDSPIGNRLHQSPGHTHAQLHHSRVHKTAPFPRCNLSPGVRPSGFPPGCMWETPGSFLKPQTPGHYLDRFIQNLCGVMLQLPIKLPTESQGRELTGVSENRHKAAPVGGGRCLVQTIQLCLSVFLPIPPPDSEFLGGDQPSSLSSLKALTSVRHIVEAQKT